MSRQDEPINLPAPIGQHPPPVVIVPPPQNDSPGPRGTVGWVVLLAIVASVVILTGAVWQILRECSEDDLAVGRLEGCGYAQRYQQDRTLRGHADTLNEYQNVLRTQTSNMLRNRPGPRNVLEAPNRPDLLAEIELQREVGARERAQNVSLCLEQPGLCVASVNTYCDGVQADIVADNSPIPGYPNPPPEAGPDNRDSLEKERYDQVRRCQLRRLALCQIGVPNLGWCTPVAQNTGAGASTAQN